MRAVRPVRRFSTVLISLFAPAFGAAAVSTQLERAGQNHARDLALAGLFAHDWSDGTSFGRWIRSFYPVSGHAAGASRKTWLGRRPA